jgi:hypothetical protein
MEDEMAAAGDEPLAAAFRTARATRKLMAADILPEKLEA